MTFMLLFCSFRRSCSVHFFGFDIRDVRIVVFLMFFWSLAPAQRQMSQLSFILLQFSQLQAWMDMGFAVSAHVFFLATTQENAQH